MHVSYQFEFFNDQYQFKKELKKKISKNVTFRRFKNIPKKKISKKLKNVMLSAEQICSFVLNFEDMQ